MPRAGQGGNVFTGPNAPRTHPSRFLCRPRSTGAVDYITGHWWLSTMFSLSLFPRGRGGEIESSNSLCLGLPPLPSPATTLHPLRISQKSPQYHQLRCEWKELVKKKKKSPFHLYFSGAVSETKYYKERCPHDSYVKNYKGFRSAVSGTVDKDQIFTSYYKSQYHTVDTYSSSLSSSSLLPHPSPSSWNVMAAASTWYSLAGQPSFLSTLVTEVVISEGSGKLNLSSECSRKFSLFHTGLSGSLCCW